MLPASVSSKEPLEKSNAARFCRPPNFTSRFFQCRRPAIIRWRTSQRSPSTPNAIRFPILRKFLNRASFHHRERRGHATQQKWIAQAHPLELLPKHARLQRGNVGRDIGQFRHGLQLACNPRALQPGIKPQEASGGKSMSCAFSVHSAIDSRA